MNPQDSISAIGFFLEVLYYSKQWFMGVAKQPGMNKNVLCCRAGNIQILDLHTLIVQTPSNNLIKEKFLFLYATDILKTKTKSSTLDILLPWKHVISLKVHLRLHLFLYEKWSFSIWEMIHSHF